MSAERIRYELSMQRFEVFKSQDPENGTFDVVFEIQGKKLYAHKLMLRQVSPTFKSMLSNQLTIFDEPVLVKNYALEDFKEFLTFIYCGECQLSKENIFSMIDIAEFYCVQRFKTICEEFLTKVKFCFENIYQMIEISNKYSLSEFNKLVIDFASRNISSFLKNEQFYGLEKCTLKKILELWDKTENQEIVFEAVYKWAEKQAKENLEKDNGLDLNNAIKNAISDLLTFLNSQNMGIDFLTFFVAEQTDIFTVSELRDILWDSSRVHVQITDENGKKIKGELKCDEMNKAVDEIKSLKYKCCFFPYWRTIRQKSLTPSKLIKNEKIDWYLVYCSRGYLVITHRENISDCDYLLAEMFAEDGFILDEKCKIEIV